MNKLDQNGVVVSCSNCGQRNRIRYEQLHLPVRCARCKTDIKGLNAPVDIDGEESFNLLIGLSSIPVLVDFWASWCGPCKMVAPEFEKLAASNAGEIIVAKVNTEDQPAIARRYSITSIPTMILFQAGHEVARTAGARPAAGIQEFLNQSLARAKA
ncbi:thioredoxin [Pedosphaera parvula]|uniref:Thioredoxin n=1 Tax=Pedosphaera parvula (strain Ellin514) TaxID=320771 RepID=B9XJW5_PEDPL|nr:thioredoxin [Pedosphaera parvula]EEF59788.1 thioredoxin [Pedosphaera parvula Ellin514]